MGSPTHRHASRPGRDGPALAARPETAVLYSVDDLATLAWVSKVTVVRLCLAGALPDWTEVDGRRYWDHAAAREAVACILRAEQTERDTRRIA